MITVAIYKRKNSGANTIFAALDMEKNVNLNGFSAKSVKNLLDAQTHNNSLEIREKIKSSIINNDLKDFSNDEDVKIHQIFNFITTENENFDIEFIDYSDTVSEYSSNPEKTLCIIKQQINDVDAIIIIEETPDNEDNLKTDNQIYNIFKNLKDETNFKIVAPIALIISKFDRYYIPPKKNWKHVNERIKNFLSNNRGKHISSLYGLFKEISLPDNLNIFAVSAYGKSHKVELESTDNNKKSNSIERPLQVEPLESFCLEDPFVWVGRQYKLCKIKMLEKSLPTTSIWNLPRHVFVLRNLIEIKNIGNVEDKAKVFKLGKKLIQKLLLLIILMFLIIYSSLLLSNLLKAHKNYIKYKAHVKLGKLSQDDVVWLNSYANATDINSRIANLFILKKEQALSFLKQREAKRKSLWKVIESLSDLQIKEKMLKSYCSTYTYESNISSATNLLSLISLKRLKTQIEVNEPEKWKESTKFLLNIYNKTNNNKAFKKIWLKKANQLIKNLQCNIDIHIYKLSNKNNISNKKEIANLLNTIKADQNLKKLVSICKNNEIYDYLRKQSQKYINKSTMGKEK